MSRKLLIRDLTLRDGQQSLFATRLRQEQIDRVLPFYKSANFYAMEVWGGAVPDSVMRYLNENPWERLKTIKSVVGDVSKLTALSRGRNLFGYTPYPEDIIEEFCTHSIDSGLGIMRIFDALNDTNNVKSTIKYVKEAGGIADCAVCYTIDPAGLTPPVFTDEYFVDKAVELESLGADMITIKDMSGLIPPLKVAKLVKAIKEATNIPLDFHTHCTPGYGLAAVLTAIMSGADIVDTNIWNFAGGPAAPAIQLIYIFCQKLGVELDIDMKAVAKINNELLTIRKEMADIDTNPIPNPFNPLTDTLPAEIDALFDKAIACVKAGDEAEMLNACHAIEDYFGFPKPNLLVQKAEVPGGMYTNMVAQLKALKSEDILEDAMKLIPTVRLAAGLPPLVTPTSQIVGAQAVNCAMDVKNGKAMYSNVSNQFKSLVKGEYGHTPVEVDADFREKLCGHRDARDFDTTNYKYQPNPILEDCGSVQLAENREEIMLLELFPMVAKGFLTGVKKAAWEAQGGGSAAAGAASVATTVYGEAVVTPLPGKVLEFLVKVGDTVKLGDPIAIVEAMKMENTITSTCEGVVNGVMASVGDTLAADTALVDVTADGIVGGASQAAGTAVVGEPIVTPLPGKLLEYLVASGDAVKLGDPVAVVEAMKMENTISATCDGFVNTLTAEVGDTLPAEAPLMDIVDSEDKVGTTAAVGTDPVISGPTTAIAVPMPGKILDIQVKVGDKVVAGQDVIVLEAMKMENSITSEISGTVAKINVAVGDVVAADSKVIEVVIG
ncbi:MAG: biotin/lipoyl-containing protein [Mangrovibacterium sp.]